MKKSYKGIIGAIAFALFISISNQEVKADTFTYVGREVTSDGTAFIAHGTDNDTAKYQKINVLQATSGENQFVISQNNGFSYSFPKTTYKYQIVKGLGKGDIDEENMTVINADCKNGTLVAGNEKGLTVITMESGESKAEVLEADPFTENGINEESVADIICAGSDNAKAAVELLAEIIDENGCSNGVQLIVADQTQAWYMESYTGHQYAAVKLPDDLIMVTGNCYILDKVDEYEDHIISDGIINPVELKDYIIKNDDDSVCLYETFGCDEASDEAVEEEYPEFLISGMPVALKDLFDLYRDSSVVGENTGATSVVQIYSDTEPELAEVIWVNMTAPTTSPFIPLLNGVNNIPDDYSKDVTSEKYEEDIASYIYKRLGTLCEIMGKEYTDGVIEFWEGMEYLYSVEIEDRVNGEWKELYEQGNSEGVKVVDRYCSDILSDSENIAADMFDDIMWTVMNAGEGDEINEETENGEDDVYSFDFDIKSYAEGLGWTVSDEEGSFTAEKNGRTLQILYDESGNGRFYIEELPAIVEEVAEDEEDKQPEDSIAEEDSSDENDEETINEPEDEKAAEVTEDTDTNTEVNESTVSDSGNIYTITSDEIEEAIVDYLADLDAGVKDEFYNMTGIDIDYVLEQYENSYIRETFFPDNVKDKNSASEEGYSDAEEADNEEADEKEANVDVTVTEDEEANESIETDNIETGKEETIEEVEPKTEEEAFVEDVEPKTEEEATIGTEESVTDVGAVTGEIVNEVVSEIENTEVTMDSDDKKSLSVSQNKEAEQTGMQSEDCKKPAEKKPVQVTVKSESTDGLNISDNDESVVADDITDDKASSDDNEETESIIEETVETVEEDAEETIESEEEFIEDSEETIEDSEEIIEDADETVEDDEKITEEDTEETEVDEKVKETVNDDTDKSQDVIEANVDENNQDADSVKGENITVPDSAEDESAFDEASKSDEKTADDKNSGNDKSNGTVDNDVLKPENNHEKEKNSENDMPGMNIKVRRINGRLMVSSRLMKYFRDK